MNPNYVNFIPSGQAAPGVSSAYAPPNNDAQLTLWDYLSLAAAGGLGAVIGQKTVKFVMRTFRKMSSAA